MTGILETPTHSDDAYSWEKNLNPLDFSNNDNLVHLFQEVCKTMNISYKKFIRVTEKIYNEMGGFNSGYYEI